LKEVDRAALPTVIEAWAVLKDLYEHRREEALWPVREKHWPVHAPEPMPVETSPRYWFEDVANATTWDRRALDAPIELRGRFSATFKELPEAGKIWEAYNRNRHNPNAFAVALGEESILLSATSKEEAERSHREGAFSKEIGHYNPVYREGEIVAIGPSARVYKLNDRTTGQNYAEVARSLKKLDRTQLQGIDATKELMHDRAEQREAGAQLFSILNPIKPVPRTRALDVNLTEAALTKAGRAADKALHFAGDVTKSALAPEITSPIGKVGRALGKTAEALCDGIESIFAPTLTPLEQWEAARTAKERAAEAADKVELSHHDDGEHARQRQELEREALQRSRDDMDR
jgi:hypothetical protein